MRKNLFSVLVVMVAFFFAGSANAQTVEVDVTNPTVSEHQGWWYPDIDKDGYCVEDGARRASSRPSGMKKYEECVQSDWDSDDHNPLVNAGAPAITNPTSATKAAWTLGKTPTDADPRDAKYQNFKSQIEACEDVQDQVWLVYEKTCKCVDPGYTWVPIEDKANHTVVGECHLTRSLSSGGGSGVSIKRLEKVELSVGTLETDVKGLKEKVEDHDKRIVVLERGLEVVEEATEKNSDEIAGLKEWVEKAEDVIDGNAEAVRRHFSQQEADELIQNNRLQNDEADIAALQDGAVTHGKTHIGGSVGAGVMFGSQTPVVDAAGTELRPGAYAGPAVTFSLFGHPFDNRFKVGGEVVGGWISTEGGMRILPSATAMLDFGRVEVGATGGMWLATTNVVGRESTVVTWGIDGGGKVVVDLSHEESEKGLKLDIGMNAGNGVCSVKGEEGQETNASKFFGAEAGLAFAF